MKTIIIGAGAAGLAAAIAAAKNGSDVTILEHENKVGKKILITGNGKCNLTNKNMDCCKYYGNKEFINDVLNSFDENDTISFFESIGLITKSKRGYIYPMSEQALTVLNTLRDAAVNLGVKIKTNNFVEKVLCSKEGFDVHMGIVMHCDNLIIATGGMAAPKTGSDGSGYKIARSMGHNIIEPKPALTALVCRNNNLNKASGVRVNAKIRVIDKEKIIGSDIGELQITDYGISGIPVFNVSRLTYEGTNIIIDFMPEIEIDEAEKIIRNLLKKREYMSMLSAMNGLFNDKLSTAILNETNLDKTMKAEMITPEQIKSLVNVIKNYKVTVKSRRGFDYAQVTQGGIDTAEINSLTMESKLVKNLYFAGEIIDVDGICGGYNLQFAWATGTMAGGNCR